MNVEVHCLPDPITNCYLIKERGLILVDAGESQKAEKLLKKLQALSINPKDISLLLVTHAHWDHAGALGEWEKISGCKVAVNLREKEWVEKGLKPQPKILSLCGVFPSICSRIMAAALPFSSTPVDVTLTDDGMSLEPFGISGRVLHTPGHTKGSISVLLETGDAFVGDLAMNGLPYRPGPGMPSLGDDAGTVKKSWRLLLDSGAKKIFPGHGKPFDADVLQKKL